MQFGRSLTLSHVLAFKLHHDFAAMLRSMNTCTPCVGPARSAVPGPDGSDHQPDGTCVE